MTSSATLPLLPADIRRGLETTWLGRRIYYVCEVDSTNRLAAELARGGEAHGTMVITDYQTAGRGRHDRRWLSPPGRDLVFSLILRPGLPSSELLPITLAFSLQIADALTSLLGSSFLVKWPNDVMSPAGKIGGILAESSSKAGRALYVVVGIGINVNLSPDEISEKLPLPAASCYSLTGTEWDRVAVLDAVLHDLESAYDRFTAKGFATLIEPYNARHALHGGTVEFERAGKTIRATVAGVRDDGGLTVNVGSDTVVLYDEEITQV